MSNKKLKIIAITLVVFVILIMVGVGVFGYYSNGFKDWSFIGIEQNTPVEPPLTEDIIINKQVVKTIIETKDYGTFILPAKYMKSCYGYVLQNGTKMNYFNEQENAKVIAYFDDDVQNHFNVIEISGSFDNYGIKLYTFVDDEFRYTYSGDVSQNLGQFHLLLSSGSEDNIDIEEFNMNVYVEEYNVYNSSFSRVIVSDTGVPLTEIIYNKIILDSQSKITYEYDV